MASTSSVVHCVINAEGFSRSVYRVHGVGCLVLARSVIFSPNATVVTLLIYELVIVRRVQANGNPT